MYWLRVVAVAVSSLLLPGAGHAILRDWMRALLFVVMYVSAVFLFLPIAEILDAESLSVALEATTQDTDMISQFALSFVVIFAVIDATLRATGFSTTANGTADGPTCPQCGRELDTDLEFCHWCTTRLERPDEPSVRE